MWRYAKEKVKNANDRWKPETLRAKLLAQTGIVESEAEGEVEAVTAVAPVQTGPTEIKLINRELAEAMRKQDRALIVQLTRKRNELQNRE